MYNLCYIIISTMYLEISSMKVRIKWWPQKIPELVSKPMLKTGWTENKNELLYKKIFVQYTTI
jgi:hypothetical protein